jgi:hypothetical protein
MLGWLASFVMPALAQRMLMGPKWFWACWKHDAMDASLEMSPWMLKMLGGVGASDGLRSWAVTLHPAAEGNWISF